ncbi:MULTISPECIES: hypothetical protein [Cuniculiplasmataceae]|uniref:hypothetical protein n=1 Tax=Cuniculiplasma sp. SKW3 TaxID=3400170 RepID=UPI003FD34D9E
MVGESKKIKISVSVEQADLKILRALVDSGKAANLSHAMRLCVRCYREANA